VKSGGKYPEKYQKMHEKVDAVPSTNEFSDGLGGNYRKISLQSPNRMI
jgi:hypothetical protein